LAEPEPLIAQAMKSMLLISSPCAEPANKGKGFVILKMPPLPAVAGETVWTLRLPPRQTPKEERMQNAVAPLAQAVPPFVCSHAASSIMSPAAPLR
jgi:hypothetical protein